MTAKKPVTSSSELSSALAGSRASDAGLRLRNLGGASASSWPDITPIEELAKVILPGYQGKGVITVLAAYFDDSGTHDGSEALVYTGLLGTVEQWAPFEAKWKAKLQNPLPGKAALRRFHMAECEAGDGDFRDYSRAERDVLIHDFRHLILESQVYGATAAIPIALWNELITEELHKKIGSAEVECFNCVVNIILDFVSLYTTEKDVALVFDRAPGREEFQKSIVQQFAAFYSRADIAGLRIHGPSFESSYNFAALQAADIIAWESNLYARKVFKEGGTPDPRAHFEGLIDSHRFRAALLKREDIAALIKMVEAGPVQ